MPKKDESAAGKRSKSAETKTTAAKKSAAKKTAPARSAAKKTAAKKAPAKKSAAKSPQPKAPAKKSAAAKSKKISPAQPLEIPTAGSIEDPIGDVSSGEALRLLPGEAESAAEMEAYRADTTGDAERGLPEVEHEAEPDLNHKEEAREPAHLERLQKILSQAGIASRRHAEEMIVAGRVMVNGQTVTQLGAKADPARDHVRVDGKLIQAPERHRTFLLNKPKGYVTTVSDPEGRPTVMQFFEKLRERLYPVGRLDFQSEGLLLMTNDGELANAVTRAAAGVEKTYLVKISGRPTEDELDQLRSGVRIDRDQPGSGKVHTAPASIRQIRPGDNPWFEVVLTEGRNRELRKMFQAVGHFVEKIRRVGYGPLVLDVEPGRFRELSPEEVKALKLTAEGKLKPRRPKSSAMLPKDAGVPAEERFDKRNRRASGPRREFRPREDAGRAQDRPRREFRPREEGGAPSFARARREGGRPEGQRGGMSFRPREDRGEFRDRGPRQEGRGFGGDRGPRPFQRREERGGFGPPRQDRPQRGGFDRARSDERREGRPKFDRPQFDRAKIDRPGFDRSSRAPRQDFRRDDRTGQDFRAPSSSRPGSPRTGPTQRGGQPFREKGGRPAGPRRDFRPREEQGSRAERPRREFGDRPGRARFDRPPREPRQRESSERPRREFRPREERGGERPDRFKGPGRPSFSIEKDERPERPRRDFSPGGERGPRPAGGSRFNRGKSRPGGFRGNRPGGPPRRDRG